MSRKLWWENTSPERVTTNAFVDDDILGDPTALATGDDFVESLRTSTATPSRPAPRA